MITFLKGKLGRIGGFFSKDITSISSKIMYYFFIFYFISLIFLLLFYSLYLFYFIDNDIYHVIEDSSIFFIGSLFFFFILRYIFLRILDKVIVKRLNLIYDEMISIKNGDFNKHRIPFRGIDELDKMAHITNLIFDMYEENIELEKKHSLIDPLTLAYNRRALNLNFSTIAEKTNRDKFKFSILLFDIDHFKKVNDTYGHDIGDLVLKELSNVIKNFLRKSDIFYRIGGEEFVIIFSNPHLSEINNVVKRLQKSITYNLKKLIPQVESEITVSGGLVHSKNFDFKNDPQLILEKMLKSCDDLLYEAKSKGRRKILIEK